MPDARKTPKPKLTLEQLLQLKRAERPDRSFWNEFDAEFRRRQLAALVSAQPWHIRLGSVSLSVLRKAAPATAAAVALAFGFALYNQQPQPATDPGPATVAATGDADTSLVVLPEEQFAADRDESVPARSTPAAEARSREQPRFAVLELNSSISQSRNFTTVTSPVAFAAAANDSGMYVVNDLTTGPVMRAPTSPVGNL